MFERPIEWLEERAVKVEDKSVVVVKGGVRDTTAWEGNDKRLGIG